LTAIQSRKLIVLAAIWALARGAGASRAVATLVLCGLMLNPQMVKNFVVYTATDIWPLMLGLLAALLVQRGNRTSGALLIGLAIGCKIVPGVLFLPLLAGRPDARSSLAFLVGLVAPALPWLLFDAQGFLLNAMLWAGLADPDPSSWTFGLAPGLVLAGKAAFAAAALASALWATLALSRNRNAYLPMALLAMLVIPLGSSFHNNYLSWFIVWSVLAIAAASPGWQLHPRAASRAPTAVPALP